jgi:prophage regulatory protein
MSTKLPETGYLRLRQIIGNPKARPPIPPLIPVSRSTWWDGVKSGRFPRRIKLGRIAVWRVEDIRALMARLDAEGGHE